MKHFCTISYTAGPGCKKNYTMSLDASTYMDKTSYYNRSEQRHKFLAPESPLHNFLIFIQSQENAKPGYLCGFFF